jgi:DeoR family glycerol-3-phosphate regulon repressor
MPAVNDDVDPTPHLAAAVSALEHGRMPMPMRHHRILQMIQAEGYLSVARIAAAFGISRMSARRDLDALSDRGLVTRSHGGAMPAAVPPPALAVPEFEARELQYDTRRRRHNAAKQAIARAAAALLGPQDNVALDVGSTVLALARELARGSGVRVLTNHLRVASVLAGSRCEVLMPGGIVRPQELSVCGQAAVEQIDRHWFTKAFIGVAGLTDLGGFDSSPEDTLVKRAYIQHADQVVLLCDQSKFGQRSLAQACTLGEIDIVITDADPPPGLAAALRAAGVQTLVATGEGDIPGVRRVPSA